MKKLLVVLLVFFSAPSFAQDVHYSMFSFASASLNPGITGVFEHDHMESDFKIFTNYRNQWRSIRSNYVTNAVPFSTYSLSSDFRLRWLRLLKYNTLGFGLMAYRDKAGDLEFGSTQLAWSVSFQKVIGKTRRDYFSVGFQNATVQRSLNYQNASFDSQWTGTAYDPTLASGEALPNPQFYYQDVNVGVSYVHRPTVRGSTPWLVGIASHHVNRASQSFSKGIANVMLKRKWVVHGSAKFTLMDKHTIYPVFLLMKQGQASEGNLTIFGGKKLGKEETQIRFGLGYRVVNSYVKNPKRDAAIMAIWILLNEWDIGFSYDTNFSGLKSATQVKGGFELFIIFHQRLDRYKSKYHKFRNRIPECPNVFEGY